ncbi:MAG: iron dependent repressor, metal binding and dimerization domain protein, partial [Cutibacterium avidum]|nr:iron dependent repressor, metal binding and dimerization domain protein [Cutibacterium avidum]
GLRPDLVHDEACRWEHVISGEVEKRLTEILDSPDVSPYGCPLPPEQIGRRPDDSARFHDDSKPLDEIIAEAGCPVSVTITRLSEFFQATEGNLTDVYAAGLLPGMSIEVKDDADGIRLTGPDGSVVVDPEVLSGLFVVQNS